MNLANYVRDLECATNDQRDNSGNRVHPRTYIQIRNIMARATSKELQKKAENELGESPERIQGDIAYMRDWISKQPHLNARTDDLWLLIFLRGCKYNLEKTKQKIDNYYTNKTLIPEFFSKRDPLLKEIQELLSRRVITVLPKTTGPAEPKLLLLRTTRCVADDVSVTTFAKAEFMVQDILCMEDPNCTIAGVSLIVDLKGLDYSYVNQITPSYIKKMVTCTTKMHPLRLKAVYCINAPKFFETIFNLAKVFVREKLRKRINIYSNLEDVYNEISRSVFPKEYGGDQLSCDEIADEWKLKLENYRDWFLEDAHYGSDESKRPEGVYTDIEIFGTEGSFRKLELD